MRKISNRHLDEAELVAELKAAAKEDPTVIAKFKEYGVDLDELDDVKLGFAELDVSAKTKDEVITLNRRMLEPANKAFEQCMPYVIHELCHVMQQRTGNLQGASAKDYLDKRTEEEAFQAQVDYKKREEGEGKAEDYVNELLDFHGVKGKKRKTKKHKLLHKKRK
jgi:hypothetical protein